MKKKVFLFSIMTAVCFVMVSCNKPAQEEQKEVLEATASPELAALRTAMDLAKYGYEAESASALIEAANILVSTPKQDLDAKAEQQGEMKGEESTLKVSFDPNQLLADAREFAGEDAILIAMADKVEAKLKAEQEEVRGAVGGPKLANGVVYGNCYVTYDVQFYGGQLAEVALSGNGATDLDLYVYDENGNLIISDTDYTDNCYVRFSPRWTGWFRLKIVNRGAYANYYTIVTN